MNQSEFTDMKSVDTLNLEKNKFTDKKSVQVSKLNSIKKQNQSESKSVIGSQVIHQGVRSEPNYNE